MMERKRKREGGENEGVREINVTGTVTTFICMCMIKSMIKSPLISQDYWKARQEWPFNQVNFEHNLGGR